MFDRRCAAQNSRGESHQKYTHTQIHTPRRSWNRKKKTEHRIDVALDRKKRLCLERFDAVRGRHLRRRNCMVKSLHILFNFFFLLFFSFWILLSLFSLFYSECRVDLCYRLGYHSSAFLKEMKEEKKKDEPTDRKRSPVLSVPSNASTPSLPSIDSWHFPPLFTILAASFSLAILFLIPLFLPSHSGALHLFLSCSSCSSFLIVPFSRWPSVRPSIRPSFTCANQRIAAALDGVDCVPVIN